MTDAERDALRVALAFAGALAGAEAWGLEASYLAPLLAGVLALSGARWWLALAMPAVAWVLCAVAAVLGDFGMRMPVALAVVLFGVFMLGFALSARRATSALGLLVLEGFALLPDTLGRYPEAADEVTHWVVGNAAAAAAAVLLSALLLPRRGPPVRHGPEAAPLLPPPRAAFALLAAVALVWGAAPAAAAPMLITVVVLLRAEGGIATSAGDRVFGTLFGGVLAVAATAAVEVVHALPVLALAALAGVWPLARLAVAPGRWQGAAARGLNAFAILFGQGFSMLQGDVEEGFGTRLEGLLAGLALAALLMLLLRRGGWTPRPARR